MFTVRCHIIKFSYICVVIRCVSTYCVARDLASTSCHEPESMEHINDTEKRQIVELAKCVVMHITDDVARRSK